MSAELGKKSVHNQVFAAWLADCFGQKALRAGSGVVDIAGGLGMICFELSVRYGVPCTLVEPREVKIKGLTRRYGKKVHRNRMRALDEGSLAAPEGGRSLMSFIKSLYPSYQDDLVVDVKGVEKMLDEDDSAPPFSHIQSLYSWPPQSHEDEILSALKEASVIIGMHSDEATEDILDAALALNKPFALVPCCVFPNENQHRLFRDNENGQVTYYTGEGEEDEDGVGGNKEKGKVVTTTEEFTEFLQAKDPSILSAKLPFMGRNTVLYRL